MKIKERSPKVMTMREGQRERDTKIKTPITEDMIEKIFDSTLTEEYKGAHSIGCRN